ncbi:MAG: alkaline phosphatase family protein, partial [Anaerolineae bacterium]
MRRKALCLASALVLTALVLLLAAWPTSGQTDEGRPYETENVFVVSIDGIRNTEAFDASYPALFVPHMWNELRPQGAIYRNFYNRAQTYTTPGNNTLINGAWEWMPNIGQRLDLRAKAPTIFEYYRREHPEVPRDKLWAVVGKANVRLAEHSIHPFYGADYGAILSFPAGHDDQAGWAEMQRVMDTYHPSLVFFHLGEVDHAGHTGNWITYTLAIRNADAIVKALWDKIQSDPVYRDRTTMIVSTDHGRHDDEHGGFKGHGGICEGDKRLIFLALGPDIRPGVEITTPREQTDIAPTVGALMGFDTPLAEGHVLTEMLI